MCPETSPHNVVLIVVLVLVPAVALLVAAVYFLMFHDRRIKRWLSLNRYHVPENVSVITCSLTFSVAH